MSGSDDTIARAEGGDLIAQRCMIFRCLETTPFGTCPSAEQVAMALTWARLAFFNGGGEDALRLFWLLILDEQFAYASDDGARIERNQGEAVAALISGMRHRDDYGRHATSLVPDAVSQMRTGAVPLARICLQTWGINPEPFESMLQIVLGEPGPPSIGASVDAEAVATRTAQAMIAGHIVSTSDVDLRDAISVVADVPDCAEKLKSPAGWDEIVSDVADRLRWTDRPVAVTVH